MQAREGERLEQVVLARLGVGGLAGVDLDDDLAGVVGVGDGLEELDARLGAASGDEVLVLGRARTVGQVDVGQTRTELALEGIWRVVVLNDPVNLMSYVVMVFKKVFGFDEQTARQKMLEVHEQGRSIVWSGLREKAEAYVFTLQQWHLTAVLEPDEAH